MTATYLAMAQLDTENAAEAKQALDKVLETQVSTLGEDNVGTLWTMHARALAYERLGDYENALGAYQETFQLRERTLGLEHIDTIRTLLGLGSTYTRIGRQTMAVDTYEKALNVMERVTDATHPDVVRTKERLQMLRAHVQEDRWRNRPSRGTAAS
jgi:Tfp pilus assembly protein PilF